MPKFKCKHHVRHNGKLYDPGDTIDLPLEQAESMREALDGLPEKPVNKTRDLDDASRLDR